MDYSALANEVGVEMNKVFRVYDTFLRITPKGLYYGYDKNKLNRRIDSYLEELVACCLKSSSITGIEITYPEYNEIVPYKLYFNDNGKNNFYYYYDDKGVLHRMLQLNTDKSYHHSAVKNADNSNYDWSKSVEIVPYLFKYYILTQKDGQWVIEEKTWENSVDNFNDLNKASKIFTNQNDANNALSSLNAGYDESDDDLEFYQMRQRVVGLTPEPYEFITTYYKDKKGDVYELIYDNGVYKGMKSTASVDGIAPIYPTSPKPSMGQTYYYIENEQVKSKVWKNDFQDKVRYNLGYELYTSLSDANAGLDGDYSTTAHHDSNIVLTLVTFKEIDRCHLNKNEYKEVEGNIRILAEEGSGLAGSSYNTEKKWYYPHFLDENDNEYELYYDKGTMKYVAKLTDNPIYDPSIHHFAGYNPYSDAITEGQTYYYCENTETYAMFQRDEKSKVWHNDFQDQVRYQLGYTLYSEPHERYETIDAFITTNEGTAPYFAGTYECYETRYAEGQVVYPYNP